MFVRSIRTPYKRRTLYMPESQVFRKDSVFFKLFQWDKSFHRQMFFTRLKILPDGDDIHIGVSYVFYGLENFIFFLAKSQHDACFRSSLSSIF